MGNLQFLYSWNGGGKYDEREWNGSKKEAIKAYVVKFYPEVHREDAFRSQVIPNINEGLRRPSKTRGPRGL